MKSLPLRACLALVLVACQPRHAAASRLDLYDPDIDGREGLRIRSVLKVCRAASLIALGAMAVDDGVRDDFFDLRNSERSRHLRSFGDQAQVAGPLIGSLFLLEGLAFDNPKSRQTALLAYQSFLLTGGISAALKSVVGRERPSKTESSTKFFKGGGDSSFPSGHTTTAFAAATVFAEQYPHWYVAVPAYGAAAAVGYSRLSANKHWMSDVAAGAAIGYGVSHLLCRRANRKNARDSEVYVAPDGVGWTKRF